MDESGEIERQTPRLIRRAERWRQAGRVLSRIAPDVYEQLLETVEATAAAIPGEHERIRETHPIS